MNRLADEIYRMVNDSPAIKSGTKSYGKSWILTMGGVLNIYGNLCDDDFLNLIKPADVSQIQFGRQFNVSKDSLYLIDTHLLKNNLDIHLRETFNDFNSFENLSFVKYLPHLKSIGFQVFHKLELKPLVEFLTLSTFGLGGYNVSLKELQSYNSLKRFWFGDKIKDFYSISSIHNLEEISIMSQNLKSLEFLFSLKKLKNLSFSFGGTTYFEELPTLVSIEQLDFWRIRKLEVQHLLPINNVENLKTLMLIELPRITNLGWIKNDKLETLVLQDMKGLQSYESLAEIGNVERLVIKDTLNKEKIDSLEKLANIKEIQVYGGYVDDHNHYIHKTKVAEKVKTMELKYQI